MAKNLSKSGISTGQDILAWHVTQSVDALTGTEAYNITISGSLDINDAPITNLTASGDISASAGIVLGGVRRTTWPTSDTNIWYDGTSYLSSSVAIKVDSHITASGNISSSGNIFAQNITLYDDGVTTPAIGSSTGNLNFSNNSLHNIVDITASALRINNGTNISPDNNGNGQLKVNGNAYTGYIAMDGTAMYLGHNSSGRDFILQTDETDRLKIEGSTGNVYVDDALLYISASLLPTSSQVLTYSTESGLVYYSDFPIQSSGNGNTSVGNGGGTTIIKGNGIRFNSSATQFQSNDGNTTGASINGATGDAKFGIGSITLSGSTGDISASGELRIHNVSGSGTGSFGEIMGDMTSGGDKPHKVWLKASSTNFNNSENSGFSADFSGSISASKMWATRVITPTNRSYGLKADGGLNASTVMMKADRFSNDFPYLLDAEGLYVDIAGSEDYQETEAAAISVNLSGSISASKMWATRVITPTNRSYGLKADGGLNASTVMMKADRFSNTPPPYYLDAEGLYVDIAGSEDYQETEAAAISVNLSGSISASRMWGVRIITPNPHHYGIKADGEGIFSSVSSSGAITASGFNSPQISMDSSGAIGTISFGNGQDQTIQGYDNSIIIDGDDYLRLQADTKVELVTNYINNDVAAGGGGVFIWTGSLALADGATHPGNFTSTHITASGNISSSGHLEANSISVPLNSPIQFNGSGSNTYIDGGSSNLQIRVGGVQKAYISDGWTIHNLDNFEVASSITASGDISSSGTLIGNKLEIYGVGSGASSGFIVDDGGSGDMVFGIGTTTPSQTLTVSGIVSSSGGFQQNTAIAASADASSYTVNGRRVEVRNKIQAEIADGAFEAFELHNSLILANSIVLGSFTGNTGTNITGSIITAATISQRTASVQIHNETGAILANNTPYTASFIVL